MNPFYLETSGSPLFAVYHAPEGAARGEGIVVCQPLGHEYFRCYRALQVLSSELAAGGYHVLRFDFSNTGNSADAQNLGFDTWVNDVSRAVRELTDVAGITTTSIIGCRLGGTACLQLGERAGSLKRLALWDPVPRGDEYLRAIDSLHEAVCTAHPSGRLDLPALVQASGDERLGLDLPSALRRQITVIEPSRFAVPPLHHLTVVSTGEPPGSLGAGLDGRVNTDRVHVDSDCGWNEPGRFTEGLAPGRVMAALRQVFIS